MGDHRKTFDQSTKDSEPVNDDEERDDYPEVPPSAMSNFVCDTCGKSFQNQPIYININDLRVRNKKQD
jgi:hypothetical protein